MGGTGPKQIKVINKTYIESSAGGLESGVETQDSAEAVPTFTPTLFIEDGSERSRPGSLSSTTRTVAPGEQQVAALEKQVLSLLVTVRYSHQQGFSGQWGPLEHAIARHEGRQSGLTVERQAT